MSELIFTMFCEKSLYVKSCIQTNPIKINIINVQNITYNKDIFSIQNFDVYL